MEYKGYVIETFGSGYTIFFQGDEIYFNSIEQAKNFIDEQTAMPF